MKRQIFFIILITALVCGRSLSQELDCNVTLQNMDQLSSESRDNASDLAAQVKQYLNGQKFTRDNFGDYKIHVEFTIAFQGQSSSDPHHYVAQAFIGSTRPINKQQKNSAMVRLKDDQWEFDYTHYQPLQHDDFQFNALTSFLDFYAYIIIGFDQDSYKSEAGTPTFEKAMDVDNRAKTAPGSPKGWDMNSSGAFNRGQYIDEILNTKFSDFRSAYYRYHFKGLDYLAQLPDKGKKNVLAALKSIGALSDRINQKSFLLQTFFETKYAEIGDTFKGYPDVTILDDLTKIDPNHTTQYTKAIRGN